MNGASPPSSGGETANFGDPAACAVETDENADGNLDMDTLRANTGWDQLAIEDRDRVAVAQRAAQHAALHMIAVGLRERNDANATARAASVGRAGNGMGPARTRSPTPRPVKERDSTPRALKDRGESGLLTPTRSVKSCRSDTSSKNYLSLKSTPPNLRSPEPAGDAIEPKRRNTTTEKEKKLQQELDDWKKAAIESQRKAMAFASQTIQIEDYAAHLQNSLRQNSEAGSQLSQASEAFLFVMR